MGDVTVTRAKKNGSGLGTKYSGSSFYEGMYQAAPTQVVTSSGKKEDITGYAPPAGGKLAEAQMPVETITTADVKKAVEYGQELARQDIARVKAGQEPFSPVLYTKQEAIKRGLLPSETAVPFSYAETKREETPEGTIITKEPQFFAIGRDVERIEAGEKIFREASPLERLTFFASAFLGPKGRETIGESLRPGGNVARTVGKNIAEISRTPKKELQYRYLESPVFEVLSSMAFGSVLSSLGKTALGKTVLKSKAGKAALMALGIGTVGTRGIEIKQTYEAGKKGEAIGLGLTTVASLAAFGLGAKGGKTPTITKTKTLKSTTVGRSEFFPEMQLVEGEKTTTTGRLFTKTMTKAGKRTILGDIESKVTSQNVKDIGFQLESGKVTTLEKRGGLSKIFGRDVYTKAKIPFAGPRASRPLVPEKIWAEVSATKTPKTLSKGYGITVKESEDPFANIYKTLAKTKSEKLIDTSLIKSRQIKFQPFGGTSSSGGELPIIKTGKTGFQLLEAGQSPKVSPKTFPIVSLGMKTYIAAVSKDVTPTATKASSIFTGGVSAIPKTSQRTRQINMPFTTTTTRTKPIQTNVPTTIPRTDYGKISIANTIQFIGTSQRRLTTPAVTEIFGQTTRTPQITKTTTTTTPRIITTTPITTAIPGVILFPLVIPPSGGGDIFGKRKTKRKVGRRQTKYKPSIVGIFSKRKFKRFKVSPGIEVRPVRR